jgi:hypothetical protein
MAPMPYETFSVVDVELDLKNPRFADPVSTQPEAINALLAQGPTKLLNLAEDIAVSGMLDPINPPIIMRTESGAIVLEGNRRFAALKLLRNPDLAQGEATKRSLAKIRAKATDAMQSPNGPSSVDCYVVDNRDAAQRWIELRHTGQNDGVGTDPWNPYQTASYRPRPTAEYRASLFVRKSLVTYANDVDLVHDIRQVRDSNKFTNFARLLGRPYVREQLQVEVKGDQVTIDPECSLTAAALRLIMRDMLDMTVDEIRNGNQQDDYIDGIIAAVSETVDKIGDSDDEAGRDAEPSGGQGSSNPAPAKTTGSNSPGGAQPSAPAEAGSAASPDSEPEESSPNDVKPSRRKPAPKGETRIFNGVILRHVNLRTSKLLKEAQKIKIADAPSVCAILVRVILEMMLTEVGVKHGWFTENANLRQKFRKALKELDPEIEHTLKRDKSLALAWTSTQQDGGHGLSVDEMNAYVHNFLASPSPESVQALTSNFRALLIRLDERAGEPAAS